jgi:hypothetical protein
MIRCFWKPHTEQAVCGGLVLAVLTGGVDERAAVQWEKSRWIRKRDDEKNHGCVSRRRGN